MALTLLIINRRSTESVLVRAVRRVVGSYYTSAHTHQTHMYDGHVDGCS